MAKKTVSLVTGNAAAAKPSKGAAYAVTQDAFDAAFNAGRTVAGAYAAAGAMLQPLLAPLSGLRTEAAVAQWRELQRGFCMGMAAERGIDADSARRQWGRLVDDMGFIKPQTAAAKAKADQRASQAPTKPSKGAPDAGDTPKAGAGAAAAGAVKMELSSMEAHLIALLRAGKFSMAAECVGGLAQAAAQA